MDYQLRFAMDGDQRATDLRSEDVDDADLIRVGMWLRPDDVRMLEAGELELVEIDEGTWVPRRANRPPQPCMDCGTNTRPWDGDGAPILGAWEYYMVHHDVWNAATSGDNGFLCIGCLEKCLGRELAHGDFIDCKANAPSPRDTPRLRARKSSG